MNLSDTDQAPYSAPAPQTATVSDEAVQAALDKCENVDWVQGLVGTGLSGREIIESALTAAIPHLALSAAPCSVEVKKLRWVHPDEDNSGFWKAKSAFGTYYVFNDCGWHVNLYDYPDVQFFEWSSSDLIKDTKQTAFDAAQADFERRILSHIVTKPVDVAAVRDASFRQGLLVAANSCDRWADDLAGLVDSVEHHLRSKAAAIRALSLAEPVDQWQDIATCEPVHALFYGTDRHGEKCVMQGYKAINGTIYIDNRDAAPVKITHWMPLTAAPTSKGASDEAD